MSEQDVVTLVLAAYVCIDKAVASIASAIEAYQSRKQPPQAPEVKQ